MTPFTLMYTVVAWVLFVPAAELRNGVYWIDEDEVGHLLFHIPDLTNRPLHAVRSIVTAPWLNHDSIQLVYVTILLLLFGIVFELREGTVRMVAIFFGTTFVSAVFGGFLLHAIYPHPLGSPFFENAWLRSWSGGSAGCFGLLGALASRARRPLPLIAIFVAWECGVWWFNLRNYTSVFHLTALATGFAATRWLFPPIRRGGA